MSYTANTKSDGLDALTSLDTGDLVIVADASDSYRAKKITKANSFDLKADLASPAFTGNPTAPTQSASDNSTKIATTAYVDAGLSTIGIIQKSGIATRDLSTASGTQTIAHGLGKTPNIVRIHAQYTSSAGPAIHTSTGVFDSSGNRCVAQGSRTDTAGIDRWSVASTTYAIALASTYVTPITTGQTGVVTVDDTNITITWTKSGSPTGTISFLWEVE